MRIRVLAVALIVLAVGCGEPDDIPEIPVEDASSRTEAGTPDGGDASPGDVPGERRVVFEGKDPGEAGYGLEVGGTLEGEKLESSDAVRGGNSVEGRIDEIGERDVFQIDGRIRRLTAGGNIEVRVDGEPRLNGPRIRSREAPHGDPIIGMTIHSSVELLETNGRVSERAVAKYAARAFEEAGFGYRIVHNLFPERPPDEKSNCSAGDAPQWWGNRVGDEWKQTVNYSDEEPEVRLEEDVNILMLTANGGGCGAIGGRYGTTPALNIDEMREWTSVGTGDWHRNIHGTLHEIGHQLGARHDHDRQMEGAQHPGSGWNEKGPEGKTWWHRTPTTAGNGAPNLCGSFIRERQTRPNVMRHQTYSDCAAQMFGVEEEPEVMSDDG